MVRREDDRVRIYSRRGADSTERFPRIAEAVRKLKVRSVLLDGEGIVCDDNGLAQFDLVHLKQNNDRVKFCAFDILELNGTDIRPRPLRSRKSILEKLLKAPPDGIEFNEHLTGDGWGVFSHACKLGCEGIVAKRIDLGYESGRSKRWVKIKNPHSPAAKRVEEGTF